MQHSLSAGGIHLKHHSEAASSGAEAATAGCNAVEVTCVVSDQRCVGPCAVRSSREVIQHGLLSGWVYLKYHSAIGSTPAPGRAVEVARGVADQRCVWTWS